MAPWNLAVQLDLDSDVPIYLQLTRRLIEAITHGRVAPGSRLPGSRSLAKMIGVHRNTVSAVYDELLAEGWITSRARSGTFVCDTLPTSGAIAREPRGAGGGSRKRGSPSPPSPLEALYSLPGPRVAAWHSTPPPAGGVDLVGGRPDLSLVPAVALARAYARGLRRLRSRILGYGDPRGHERLRIVIAEMLRATRGLAVGAENIVITSGSQMALYVVVRALVRPGEAVAVEALGYRTAWRTLSAAGARLRPVPIDAEGLRVDKLAEQSSRERIRAVYLTPHHQYPTTVALSPRRRMELLHLARTRRFAILEDDYDHEIHFDGHPLVPLASTDRLESVLYLGSLSKIFAPGLRLGYAVAPPRVLERLAAQRSMIDLSGNAGIEIAVAELFEEGEVQRHLRRMARIYQVRRDALVSGLRKELCDVLAFEIPSGGTAVWCRVLGRSSVEAWVERCRAAGAVFQGGSAFTFRKRSIPFVRIGFTRATEDEIAKGIRVMASCWRDPGRGT